MTIVYCITKEETDTFNEDGTPRDSTIEEAHRISKEDFMKLKRKGKFIKKPQVCLL